jgi:hypothetical protein
MRLEAVAKAGFYPTPPRTLSLVVELLKGHAPHLRGHWALDPCAGEGEALAQVGQALGMKTQGIELDAGRAEGRPRSWTGSTRGTPSGTGPRGSGSSGSTRPTTTGTGRGLRRPS